MPADANAFQRLIDRVLFPDAGASEDDSSRPWRLLQSLLAQNAQARNYAQRIVLQRATERPEDLKSGGERLRSLLELWPPAEREMLVVALDRQASGASTLWESIQVGANNSSMISDTWSPSGHRATPSGYSTPPRTGGGTPTWGPPLSDSPPPPRQQYARQQVALAQMHRDRGDVRFGRQSVTDVPPNALVGLPTFVNPGGVQVVDSTATTMPIQFSRESRQGRLELEDSTSTVRRETASSLDAWLRKSMPHQPLEGQEQEVLRSRSLPAQNDGSDARSRQLVLDLGPSSSSSGDDKKSQDRIVGRRASTMSTVVESSKYTEAGKDIRRLMQNTSHGANSRSSSSDDTARNRCMNDDVRPWSRPRRQSKQAHVHDSRNDGDRIKETGALKSDIAQHVTSLKLDDHDFQSWRKFASNVHRSTLQSIISGCRFLRYEHHAVAHSSRCWRRLSTYFIQRQVHNLSLGVTSAAAECARAKCVTARWHGLALGHSQLRQREIVAALSQTNRAAFHLRRSFQVMSRRGLRMGFQSWRHFHSLRKVADANACSQVQKFQSVCERARALGRASEIGRFIMAMRQCGQERHSQRESACKALVAWMDKRLHYQLRRAFGAFQGVVYQRSATNSVALERLAGFIEKLKTRRAAAAMSSMHSAILSNLTVAEASARSQGAHWAMYRCLREAMRVWQLHHRRLRRLHVAIWRISWRAQQWAWHHLNMNCVRKKYESHGVACAAKLEHVRIDSEMSVEAVRLELGAQLRAAKESILEAQKNENDAKRAHMKTRLQRIAWGVWNRARQQDQAVRRLVIVIGKQVYRRGFTSLRRHATRNAITYLNAQVDCFDKFVSRRSALSSSIFEKCTSEWASAFDDTIVQLILVSWHREATYAKRAFNQRLHACRMLMHVCVQFVRRESWTPWISWQFAEKQRGLRFDHEVQIGRMHQEQENLRIALRATKLQTEATVDTLGHQVREQEQINWTVAMEVQAVQVYHAAYLWKAFALNHRTHALKQISSLMWQGHVAVRRSSRVVSTWRSCARRVCSVKVFELRAALWAAASEHRRKQCEKWERCAKAQKTSYRWLALMRTAHDVNTKNLVRGVAVGFARLADAKRRLRSLLRICKSLELRVVMRRLHGWSQHQILQASHQAKRGVALSCDRYSGARLLRSVLGAMVDRRQRCCFGRLKLERQQRRRFVEQCCAKRGAHHIEKIYRKRVSEALGLWRAKSLRVALHGMTASFQICTSQRLQWLSRRRLLQTFRTWHGVTHGPRRLCSVLDRCTGMREKWAWQRFRYYCLRRGHEKLTKLYISAASRRCYISILKNSFVLWSLQYCTTHRIQRNRVRHLHKYMALRMLRFGFHDWLSGITYRRRLRRMDALLRKAPSKVGFGAWHAYASKTRMAVASKAERHLRQALAKQRNDCERLMERRSLECAQRTATALLHSWRCAAQAEAAVHAQRSMAARSLSRVVAALCRGRKQSSLERWRAAVSIHDAEEFADSSVAMYQRSRRLEQVQQGARILQGILDHRRHLAASQALNGTWRTARWQATVRALDASTLREQRKMRADGESLRTRIKELEKEASHLRKLQENEADRNSQAQEEVRDIMSAVRRERLQNEAIVQTLEMELQRSQDSEAVAMERVCEAENRGLQELAMMEGELQQARASNTRLEDDRRNTMRELTATQNELYQASVVVDESDREGRFLAQNFDTRARCLEEKASALETTLRNVERDAEARVQRVEHDAHEQAKLKAATLEERARFAEQEVRSMLAERDRASEMQASRADEQERAIRRLEGLLKQQGDELRRERQDHSKGLEELRTSSSLSESKTHLFEEQVVALRQQLHREQSEVRASERAWAGDRAALLAAVANCAAQGALAGGHPVEKRSGGARRKSPQTSLQRSSDSVLNIAGRAGSCRGCIAGSGGACPWHGNGVKPLATRGPV